MSAILCSQLTLDYTIVGKAQGLTLPAQHELAATTVAGAPAIAGRAPPNGR